MACSTALRAVACALSAWGRISLANGRHVALPWSAIARLEGHAIGPAVDPPCPLGDMVSAFLGTTLMPMHAAVWMLTSPVSCKSATLAFLTPAIELQRWAFEVWCRLSAHVGGSYKTCMLIACEAYLRQFSTAAEQAAHVMPLIPSCRGTWGKTSGTEEGQLMWDSCLTTLD